MPVVHYCSAAPVHNHAAVDNTEFGTVFLSPLRILSPYGNSKKFHPRDFGSGIGWPGRVAVVLDRGEPYVTENGAAGYVAGDVKCVPRILDFASDSVVQFGGKKLVQRSARLTNRQVIGVANGVMGRKALEAYFDKYQGTLWVRLGEAPERKKVFHKVYSGTKITFRTHYGDKTRCFPTNYPSSVCEVRYRVTYESSRGRRGTAFRGRIKRSYSYRFSKGAEPLPRWIIEKGRQANLRNVGSDVIGCSPFKRCNKPYIYARYRLFE